MSHAGHLTIDSKPRQALFRENSPRRAHSPQSPQSQRHPPIPPCRPAEASRRLTRSGGPQPNPELRANHAARNDAGQQFSRQEAPFDCSRNFRAMAGACPIPPPARPQCENVAMQRIDPFFGRSRAASRAIAGEGFAPYRELAPSRPRFPPECGKARNRPLGRLLG